MSARRFPAEGKRSLVARFPNAERFIQLRVFDREGNEVTVEGHLTTAESKRLLRIAIGNQPIQKVYTDTPMANDDEPMPPISISGGEQ